MLKPWEQLSPEDREQFARLAFYGVRDPLTEFPILLPLDNTKAVPIDTFGRAGVFRCVLTSRLPGRLMWIGGPVATVGAGILFNGNESPLIFIDEQHSRGALYFDYLDRTSTQGIDDTLVLIPIAGTGV